MLRRTGFRVSRQPNSGSHGRLLNASSKIEHLTVEGFPAARLNGLSRITPAWRSTQCTHTALPTQFPADREKSREIPPSGSKLMGELNAVFLPERADWLPDFEAELFAFPGAHHDQHDSISQALFKGVRPGPSAAHLLAPLIGYPGEAIRFFLAPRRIVTARHHPEGTRNG